MTNLVSLKWIRSRLTIFWRNTGQHETGETHRTHTLDQERDTSFPDYLVQTVMAHSRLLKHTGYTPLQLLFGHEPTPIEGEAFHNEQQNRSIAVFDGRENKKAVSRKSVVANRSPISRYTNTESTHKRCSTLTLWTSCLLLQS